jgi:hypothetical protein
MDFRKWVANKLVRLAWKIDPMNEQVISFWAKGLADLAILGKSSIKVSYEPSNTPPTDATSR